MSAEHFVSVKVLRLVGNGVRVTGIPWQKPNEYTDIGIGSAKSKILCKHHNEILSLIDDEGFKFIKEVKDTYVGLSERRELSDITPNINAELLELWLLKVFIGCMVVSGIKDIPEKWIDCLFQKINLPDDAGLYIPLKNEGTKWEFYLLKMESIDNLNHHIAGVKFLIGGLSILFTFGPPFSNRNRFNYLHRPSGLVFGIDDKKKGIQFTWAKYKSSKWLLQKLEAIPNK